jgi:hypothetical protein
MAAISYGRATGWGTADRLADPRVPSGRSLRVLPGAPSRPSAGVLRRRRLVAAIVLGLVLLASLRLAEGVLGATGRAGDPARSVPATVVAQRDDTYFSLAARLDLGGDLRATVDALVRANGGHDLRPGDRIQLR